MFRPRQNTATPTIISDYTDEFVTVTLELPSARGWEITKFVVNATCGNDTEVFESTTSSIKVRLKIGTWSFSANALDSNGNILYSAATTATIGLKSSSIYIGLIKRAGQA